MAFLKFQADQLFTGTKMLDNSHVLVTNEQGIIHEIVSETEAGDDIQKFNGILAPGFINCHCHLELSHMKGLIPEHTGLVDFVFKVVTQRHFPDEEIHDAINKAEVEMLQNGIVAVGDICNNLLTLPQKLKQNVAYYNFIEASGWLPSVAKTRFERAKSLYDHFKTGNRKPETGNSIVPHAPYSVSKELWQQITPYFQNKVATIHNQETSFEDEFFTHGTGDFIRMYEMMKIDNRHHQPTAKSSLQSYFANLQKAKFVLLVHNSYTSTADIRFAIQQADQANQLLSWCLCINANKYIEEKFPPIHELRQNKANIVLGTDSLASNWSLNLLDEMKAITQHFPSIPLAEILQWSTYNGAVALQVNDKLGSFETSKQPGIVLIENVANEQLTPQSNSRRIL